MGVPSITADTEPCFSVSPVILTSEVTVLARRRSLMSDQLKYELAQELGFADKVQQGDWGNITTREAGNLVKAAIIRAEQQLAAGAQLPPNPDIRR